jgi:hypothetical protein
MMSNNVYMWKWLVWTSNSSFGLGAEEICLEKLILVAKRIQHLLAAVTVLAFATRWAALFAVLSLIAGPRGGLHYCHSFLVEDVVAHHNL